jgi:hypothetical protein
MALFKSTYTRAQIDEAIGRALNIVAEGKTYNNRGAWVSEGSYSNTEESIDVVIYDGTSYFCVESHSGETDTPAEDGTHWAPLHAYETFIKNAPTGEIADDDTVPFTDTSENNRTKKITWSNIKAKLKQYFDTLYTTAMMALTGYEKPSSRSAIAPTDTINQAIGKVEAGIEALSVRGIVKIEKIEKFGDCDNDGFITSTDALKVANYITGSLSSEDWYRSHVAIGDVNLDGEITQEDYDAIIARAIGGPALPIGGVEGAEYYAIYYSDGSWSFETKEGLKALGNQVWEFISADALDSVTGNTIVSTEQPEAGLWLEVIP